MKEKIICFVFLLLFTLPFKLHSQDTPTDSCTIYISTGYYGREGWNNSYLQILQQGQVVATVQHRQWTPNTYSVTVPVNEKTDFNWISDNTEVSFYILSSAGDILYIFKNIRQNGIFFSYHVCSTPHNVSNITITPDAVSTQGATISWTNPTSTVNNDPLQTIDSIVLLKNGMVMNVFYNLTPGTDTQYTDNSFQTGDYYTVITYNGPAASKPLYATGPACRYRLVLDTGWYSWFCASLNFSSKGHFLGEYSLPHNGSATYYVYLPNDWITIEHQGINGHFKLYDEENNLVLSGPNELPEYFLWYNGCSLAIPDTVSAFSCQRLGNTVNLSWINPTQTASGDSLTTLSKIEIRRNEQLIQTFTNVSPGGQSNFSDTPTEDGTYQYSIQCFNEAGGGGPVLGNAMIGSNGVLHNLSNSGDYVDTSCLVSISNDMVYTLGGKTKLTVFQSDTTKILKVSGSAALNDCTSIRVYAGTENDGALFAADTLNEIVDCHMATFMFDIPVNATPVFHYTVECVNKLYEQPDTTVSILPDTNGIIYVTQTGAGLRNGSSWANATPWLNHALSIADTMTKKPVIWVAAGTYYGAPQEYDNTLYAFLGRNGVNVYGGFAGNEPANYDLSLRDFEQNETVLDGLLHHSVVLVNNHSEWNGFHITKGTNGCYLSSFSYLRHSIINKCVYHGITGYQWSLVDSCIIVDNGENGISISSFALSNSLIARNGRTGVSAVRAIIHNCNITQNGGDGIYVYRDKAIVSNSLITNNGQTGVVFDHNGSLLNSTIANNAGSGIFLHSNSILRNSIISGNGGVSISNGDWGSDHEISNCAIEGYYLLSSNNNIPLSSPDNPSGIQPGFVNPTTGRGKLYGGGDWHLLPNSVCVNRGKVTYNNVYSSLWTVSYNLGGVLDLIDSFPTTDLDGNLRIRHDIPDIGAFESDYSLQVTNHFIHPDTNHIIYITENGNGDGSSWQNATSDLVKTIELVWLYDPGTQIWVAQGNYPTDNVPFYVKENLKLFGGFEGNEPANYPLDLRNTLAHATVLDGQNQNRVLHQTRDFESPAVVDGFTLTHGNADQGAGAYLMSGTALSKCRVVNNTAGENGAAIYAVRDSLKQVLVVNNDGVGVMAQESQIIHCDVVRNSGGGVWLSVDESPVQQNHLLNTIIWGNQLLSVDFANVPSKANTSIINCAIDNYTDNEIGSIRLLSDNDAEAGPHFVMPTDSAGITLMTGNWRLDSSSICLNAGADNVEAYGITTDMTGQPRVQQGRADIGALESSFSNTVCARNMEASIYEGETFTFYGTTLSQTGWYAHRWQSGSVDSVVTLHLIVKHIIYVSVNGSGLKDGSSWANALDGETATDSGRTKLANALINASINTDFWLQSGTYHACSDSDVTKSLILNEGIALYGGFDGTENSVTQRNFQNAPTLFSGNLQQDSLMEHYSNNVFITNERNTLDHPILLDHISVAEGHEENHTGCALRINGTSEIRAEHCRFHHNFGSAIYNEGLFTGNYCLMDSNVSFCSHWTSEQVYYDYYMHYEGAGAFTNKHSGIAILRNCQIVHNTASYDGALFNGGVMEIDSSDISHNTATDGTIGAIFSIGSLMIQNSHLSYNFSYEGFSTIASWGPLFKMHNCTLEYNQSNRRNPLYYWPAQRWAAIHSSAHVLASGGNVEVTDCLFRRNSQNGGSGGGCLHFDGGYATIRHCDFQENIGSLSSSSEHVNWGDGEDDEPSGGIVIHSTMVTLYNDGSGLYVDNGEVYVEDCTFDRHEGMNGSTASVRSGKLVMNRCRFTRNISNFHYLGGVLSIFSGELHVMNSLFANNQDMIYNTELTVNSKTTFTNCTFANNGTTLCLFIHPLTSPNGCDSTWVNTDTAHVVFKNCIIHGNWEHAASGIGECGTVYEPNYTIDFTNTLFDTLHTTENALVRAAVQPELPQLVVNIRDGAQHAFSASELLAEATIHDMLSQGNVMVDFDSDGNRVYKQMSMAQVSDSRVTPKVGSATKNGPDCTPDSAGNIYYCDPMFVNPTTVMGVDTLQDPLLYDFRLLPGSPAINSGDTTGTGIGWNSADLAGEHRIKQCTIDRGCYEFGTVDYDTVRETLCVEPEALEQLSYSGHGFSTVQLKVGENSFTRNCDCYPDANDTVLTLQLLVSLVQHTEFDTVVCDSMVWNSMAYTQSGTYTQTLTDATGCDSVVTMLLTVNNSTFSDMEQMVCGSYEWNGIIYTESGTYTQTFTNMAGCDSVVTLHLTLYHEADTVIYDHFCNGSTYPFFGQQLSFAGTYTHTGQTVHGCDSTVTLHLEMQQIYFAYLNEHLCDGEGYDFFGETLHTSGTYIQVVPTVYGCDSTIVLTMTTGVTTYGQTTASICEGNSYNFHGQLLTTEGDYTKTLTNASGCDSIVTLHLTVSHATVGDTTAVACESFTWGGNTYTESGDYTSYQTNVSGCDSVVTLHLTINESVNHEFAVTCSDSCYIWNGQTYCASGDYTQTFETVDGCDSVVTLHLTITVGIGNHDLANTMMLYPNPTSDVVNVQLTMNNERMDRVDIQVFDVYGRLLEVVTMGAARGASLQTIQINLSRYANGVYFVKAVSDEKVVAVRKVVKD